MNCRPYEVLRTAYSRRYSLLRLRSAGWLVVVVVVRPASQPADQVRAASSDPIQDQHRHRHQHQPFSHSGRSASRFGLNTIPFPYQWENMLRPVTRAYAYDSVAHRSPAKGGLIQLVRLSSNLLLPSPIPMMDPINCFCFLSLSFPLVQHDYPRICGGVLSKQSIRLTRVAVIEVLPSHKVFLFLRL